MAGIPVIYCTSGALKGTSHSVLESGLRLGREEGNDIRLDDNGVSRQHARFIIHNGSLWVQDAGSRNGIFVNDERVQTQRQLNIGDIVKIGKHLFEVRVEQPRAPVAVEEPSGASSGGWKLWPFVATFAVLGFLLLLVVVAGRPGKAPVEESNEPDAVVGLLLSTTQGVDAPATVETEQKTAPPASGSLLATALLPSILGEGESQKDEDSKWPEPPAGMTAGELIERGHNEYRAGRLHDALVAYHQAKTLKPECEICDRRIDRLNAEISEAIEAQFNDGLVYFNNLQYQQAINSWETVLMLQPDPESARHKETQAYLEKARASVQHQY